MSDTAAELELLKRYAPDLRAAGVRELEMKDGKLSRVVMAPPDPPLADPDDRPSAPINSDPLFDNDTFGRSKVPGSAQRRGDDDDEG